MYIIPISEDRTRRSLSWSPEAIDSLCKEVDGARVRFLGTPFFEKYDRVIVSFPGAHGRAWNKLIQGAGGWKTSCVFLPDEDAPGYGVHVKNDSPQCCHAIWGVTPCFCHMLYGQPEPWGCRWYQMWVENTRRAAEMDAELVVVTKADGSLGRSQKGEVEFLETSGYEYRRRSVREFAEDVLDIFMPDCNQYREYGMSLPKDFGSKNRK